VAKKEKLGSLRRAFSKLFPQRARTAQADSANRRAGRAAERVQGGGDHNVSASAPEPPAGEGNEVASTAKATVVESAPLVADDGPIEVDPDETDELLVPSFSIRIGLDNEKARQLFEKHGFRYAPRRIVGEGEPPAKLRRVEKPIRMRLHWVCHECQCHFTKDKICKGCGHPRCDSCIKTPSKKVKQQIVAETKQANDAQAEISIAPTLEPNVELDEKAGATISTEPDWNQPLQSDDQEGDGDREDLAQVYKYTMHVRPKNAEYLILRPKTQIIRRQCHKCETPFLPASRTECENCQHTRCTLCPRWPPKADKWPAGSPGDEQPLDGLPSVRPVQRVYKKPRQRVRYTCHHCQALFVDPRTCGACGHGKCDDCTRYPYVSLHYHLHQTDVLTLGIGPRRNRRYQIPSSFARWRNDWPRTTSSKRLGLPPSDSRALNDSHRAFSITKFSVLFSEAIMRLLELLRLTILHLEGLHDLH
jgi:hypothetical protein